MSTLRVREILQDRILLSRETARLLEDALRATMASSTSPENPREATPVTLDFEGVAGIAPSFLDELLSIFETLVAEKADGAERRLVVANPPTRLSLKFEAVARGHGMSVRALPEGSWLLSSS